MLAGAIMVIFASFSRPSSLFGSAIFWLFAGGAWFAWRRGWIQAYFEEQNRQKQVAKESEVKKLAEAKQQLPVSLTENALPRLTPNAITYPIFRIHVPSSGKLSPIQASGLIRTLLAKAQSGLVELSLVGNRNGIHWEVAQFSFDSEEDEFTPEELNEVFSSYYPGAVVERAQLQEPTKPLFRRYNIYKPHAARYFDRALNIGDIVRDDPLAYLAQALVELEAGETFRYTVTVSGIQVPEEKEIMRVLTVSAKDVGFHHQASGFSGGNWEAALGYKIGATVMGGIMDVIRRNERVQAYSDAETKRFLEKLTQPLALCHIAVTFDTPAQERLKSLERVDGVIAELSGEEIRIVPSYVSPNLVIGDFQDWILKTPNEYVTELAEAEGQSGTQSAGYYFALTVDEVAALWHLPHAGFPSSLLGTNATHVPIARGFSMGEQGVKIGINRMGHKSTDVFLPPNDRTAHTAIIGKTGRGKSSLLHHMVHQDIAAGRGVCVIDPNGSLVSNILQQSIPPEREEDVLILDVGNLVDGVFYPPPLNLFVSGIEEDQQFQAAQRLVSLFALTDQEFAEKRMGNTLRQALMAVQVLPNPTINDVYCLLFDDDYRNRLLPLLTNDIVANYWRKFDMKRENEQSSISQPLEWRIERFMLNTKLRTMSCHPTRLNIGKLMAANKIILVSLGDVSGTLPSDELHLMGAALLMQIEYAARRKVITKPPFMVYLDEAQEFVDTNLPTMLSQLRGFGVGLVLANQYFDQLFGKTLKAIEGNISTLVAFEVGKDDARTLLPYVEPGFTDNALVALGKYTAAVSMLDSEGRRGSAFSIETLPPPGHGKANLQREVDLRRKVIERWRFKPYDEVLTSIQERYANCGATALQPKTTQSDKADNTHSKGYGEFFE
jgi:hypothetical protein